MIADTRGMIFLVPGKAYLINAALAKGHWYRAKRRNEVKDAAREVIDRFIPHVEDCIPYPHVEIECTMQYERKHNLCDTDAPAPMRKAVMDVLVEKGVIAEDTGDIVHGVKYLPPVGGQDTEGLLMLVHPVKVEA